MQTMSVASQANPVAIHKHLRHGRIAQVIRRQLLELLNTPILELVDDVSWVASDRDERHQSQILDKTARLTFWRFSRANHTPVRVV